jgi:hypothetical protein
VTEEAILAMRPGRELNMKVAKDVMWHEVVADEIFGDTERYIDNHGKSVYGPLRSYSEDDSDAKLVVEKMLKLGYGDAMFWKHCGDESCTQAEAICKMALVTMLEREGKPIDE